MEPSMLETIRAFFASQPVVKAWLFGSYSRGEQTEESDIDILVDFDREHATIGLFEYVRMINKLKALTGKEIDLVENGSLLPFADETAQRDKLLIYERGC
ncbi:MAG: nucleotidyltransferase domain-containing protein [Bacteroidales bacterium]|nr:nucleotidyltransferase domain-containing protein [Bacteroidales bacterium]